MLNKKAITNIISLLLTILIVLAIASTMYFWFAKLQPESQQIGTQYQDKTLGNVITEVIIVDDAVYNTLAEGKQCLPATITLTIQNTGAKNLKINNDSTILVSDGDGPICLSKFDGACTDSEDRLYAATDNGGSNANVSYSTDGTTWSVADTNVGSWKLISSIEFNDELYFGGYFVAAPADGAQVYKSCDSANWQTSGTFTSAYDVYDLEVFNGELYAATGSGTSLAITNGSVHKLYSNLTWKAVHESGDLEARALEVFESQLYAGIAFEENLTRTSDGTTWTVANGTLGNVTALFADGSYLYAGLDGGQIWRSTDGADFGINPVVSTGDDAVLAFEKLGSNVYAATNKSGAASIFQSSNGADWTEVYKTEVAGNNNDTINDFAVFLNCCSLFHIEKTSYSSAP